MVAFNLIIVIAIATDESIEVRRKNADYLLSIRRGNLSLEAIIKMAEKDLVSLDELYAISELPLEWDKDFLNELLIAVRHLNPLQNNK